MLVTINDKEIFRLDTIRDVCEMKNVMAYLNKKSLSNRSKMATNLIQRYLISKKKSY